VRRGVPAPTELWVYKRGLLVLHVRTQPGVLTPTLTSPTLSAPPQPCPFCSGQFLSVEWEPRVRVLLGRARSLSEFIEVLRDRRYAIDTHPPSLRLHPTRSL
jgi:hypothetical protein